MQEVEMYALYFRVMHQLLGAIQIQIERLKDDGEIFLTDGIYLLQK